MIVATGEYNLEAARAFERGSAMKRGEIDNLLAFANIAQDGQLIIADDPDLAVTLILILEENAAPHLAAGRLVHVLEAWCVPFGGLHLYDPSRHVSPALRALIDALR